MKQGGSWRGLGGPHPKTMLGSEISRSGVACPAGARKACTARQC